MGYDPIQDGIDKLIDRPADTSGETYKKIQSPATPAGEAYGKIKLTETETALLGDSSVNETQGSEKDTQGSISRFLTYGVSVKKLVEKIKYHTQHAENGDDASFDMGGEYVDLAKTIPKSKWTAELFESCISFLFIRASAHIEDERSEEWMRDAEQMAIEYQENHAYDENGYYWQAMILFQNNEKHDSAVEVLKCAVHEAADNGKPHGYGPLICPKCCMLLVEYMKKVNNYEEMSKYAESGAIYAALKDESMLPYFVEAQKQGKQKQRFWKRYKAMGYEDAISDMELGLHYK